MALAGMGAVVTLIAPIGGGVESGFQTIQAPRTCWPVENSKIGIDHFPSGG